MQWANIKRSLALIVFHFVSCDGVGEVGSYIYFGWLWAGAVVTLCGSVIGLWKGFSMLAGCWELCLFCVAFWGGAAVTLCGLVIGLWKEFSKLGGCWRGWGCCDSLWIFMD